MRNFFISILLLVNLNIYAKPFLWDFNQQNPHRIYLGPEVFLFELRTKMDEVKVNGKKCFFGLKLGYEYLRPQFFYAGIDLLCAGGDNGFHSSFNGGDIQNKGPSGFGNLDIRLGYTFACRNGLVTPFLGIGSYAFGNGDMNGDYFGFNENMAYYEGGIRSRYEISPAFNVGLNVKIFRTADREQKFKHPDIDVSVNSDVWGSEIGIPFIWIFYCRTWDIQLEPYFQKFNTWHVQNIYGTRLLFGYRF